MIKKMGHLMVAMLFCLSFYAQTEAEIVDQANKLFKNEKYVEATPLYLRLLSLSPKNSEYNYRYGTCLLFNADKKQDALRYLKFATDNPPIDPLAFFFLGRAYHLNYLFNDAVRSYEKFASLSGPKEAEVYQIARLVETCQNGRRLLMNYSEMIVFDKKEIESDKFFRLYDMKELGGSITVTAEYQSKLDKKKGHIPLIYFPKNASEIYYSSYGESEIDGKQIYRKRREPAGGWGEAELVKGKVNTKYDEDFCYRSPDGKYLYFSSKGHNSMGGYDVFRSEYDQDTDSFGEPENMDFAVSSPDDDIFFLVDAKNENGYFASARQSEVGKLYVYKIRVDKLPSQLSIIAGRYESKISPKLKKLTVDVENPDGDLIGTFASNSDGQIILTFPQSGQYKYKMRMEGSEEVFFANVNVPSKRDIKPVRQSFMHFMEDGKEVVRVLDRFDEAVLDKDEVLASVFAGKATLDPNADKFDVNSLKSIKENDKILAEVGAEDYTLTEIANEMEGKARAIRKMENEAGDIEKKAAFQIEAELKIINEINSKLAENAKSYRDAQNNSMTKQNLLMESKELLAQKAESEDKIEDLIEINKKVQENLVLYQDQKERAADWEKKGAELQKLLKEDKNAEALQLIAQNKVVVKSAMTDTVDDYQTTTTFQINNLNKELTELNSRRFNYETSSKDLRNNIDYLERFLLEGKAENPEETKKNIELKKKDLVVIHNEIRNIEETVKNKRLEKEFLTDELSEFNELDNKPLPKEVVLMQLASIHWEELKKAPENKEADYLAEVIRDVENGNIVLTEQTVQARTSDELLVAANPQYKDLKASLENNANLTTKDKANQLANLEKENKSLLTDQINTLSQKIQQDPNNAAFQEERASLNKLVAKAEANLTAYNNTFEQERSKEIAQNMTPNSVLQELDNTFVEVEKHINEDTNQDKVAQLRALAEHDAGLITKIEKRKGEITQELKVNPNKKAQVDKEMSLLSQLQNDKSADLATRNNEITRLQELASNTPIVSAFSKLSPKEQDQTILNQLNQSYVAQKETFSELENRNLGSFETELALDRLMLEKLTSNLDNFDPKTESAEITATKRLINDATADIAQNETKISELNNQIATNPVNSFDQLSYEDQEKQVIADINTDYSSQKESLKSIGSNRKTDVETELKLDKAMLAQLGQEKSKLNPQTDATKIIVVERLEEKTRLDIAENELNLLAVDETRDQLINRLDEDYSEELAQLENSSLNELERTKSQVALDDALIEVLSREKAKLSALIEEHPEVESLEIKAAQIDELIQEKSQLLASRENRIKEINTELASINSQPDPPLNTFEKLSKTEQEKVIQEQLNWNYEEDKSKIQESNKSEEEKAMEYIALDKSAQRKLTEEKSKLDPQTQSAEIAAIERIEADIQSSLANNQMNLLALPETEKQLVSRIAKNIVAQQTALENNSEISPVEKLKQMVSLDQALIKNLEQEKVKFNRLGNDNPQVSSLKEKVTEIESVISSKRNEIAENKKEIERLESLAFTEPETNPVNKFEQLSILEQEKAILREVSPSYEREKTRLVTIGNKTTTEIQEELTLDQELIQSLTLAKNKLDKSADASKIKAIERLETATKNDINKNTISLVSAPETEGELLKRVADKLTSDLQSIERNNQLTDLEKAKKSIEINQSIIKALENERKKVTTLSSANPSNENLTKKVFEISQALTKKEADIAILEKEVETLNAQAVTAISGEQSTKIYKTVDALRNEFLGDGQDEIMISEETTAEGLQKQLDALEKYEVELQTLDSKYQFLETNNGENFQEERSVIAEELATVQRKKRIARITIGDIEREVVENNSKVEDNASEVISAKYDNPALQKIVDEENQLRESLNEEVSMKESRKIEKKLIEVIDQRIAKENDITESIVRETKKENDEKLELLKSLESKTVTERLQLELAESKVEELNQESKDLEQKAKKAKSPVEEAELLSQAMAKQQEASDLLEMSYVDTKIDRLTKGKINTLMTNSELEARRKYLLIEESNHTAKINTLDEQLKNTTSSKEEDKLLEERKDLVEKRTQINDQIAKVDKKISQAPTKATATLPKDSKEKEISYLEERKIAEGKTYKELSTAYYDAQFLEKEIELQLIAIDREKSEAMKLVEESMTDPSEEIDELIANKVEIIQQKEARIIELKAQLAKRQMDIKNLMPKDPKEAALVNNLLARGVDPMSKSDAVGYVPIPEDGFAINTTNTKPKETAKPIQAESEMPSGLMYRVQVGAFSKPVAESVFNEFTPVSAEKRSNGIIVYMAGYFEGNSKAYDAQKSIRNIGYSDAFVVAYCGGKRITLAEAKRLEETNACTPIQINELAIQAPAPKDTTKIMITELDYYKGIGAAQAFPVETKKGLFYTVQLGVYNKPVSKATLKEMSPLITKRLPNGQIRYSAGVYVSIEEALPKRKQAFDKGISDAYITAYYNGERISLAEAEKLLQENGTAVIEKTAIGVVKDVESRLDSEKKLNAENQKNIAKTLQEGVNLQLVSKKQFDEFPRDILNRFNSHASFYYDINDKRIKSNLYKKLEDIPQIYFLRNELDTIYVSDQTRLDNVKKKDLRNVVFEISSTQLDGDLTDLLLRLNYRKEFVQEGSVIKVILHEVPTGKVQDISDRLRTLKIRSEVQDPALRK